MVVKMHNLLLESGDVALLESSDSVLLENSVLSVSLTDGVGSTDGIGSLGSFSRHLIDIATVSDNISQIAMSSRQIWDVVSQLDSLGVLGSFSRHLIDGIGSADSTSSIFEARREIVDVCGLSDEVVVKWILRWMMERNFIRLVDDKIIVTLT